MNIDKMSQSMEKYVMPIAEKAFVALSIFAKFFTPNQKSIFSPFLIIY